MVLSGFNPPSFFHPWEICHARPSLSSQAHLFRSWSRRGPHGLVGAHRALFPKSFLLWFALVASYSLFPTPRDERLEQGELDVSILCISMFSYGGSPPYDPRRGRPSPPQPCPVRARGFLGLKVELSCCGTNTLEIEENDFFSLLS